MLTITVPETEFYDQSKEVFTVAPEVTLELEHSLASLSKWESIYEKPFLKDDEKTDEETLGYIKAMTLTPGIPDEVYNRLTPDHISEIGNYMSAKMTATWFAENKFAPKKPKSREIITAELIYYWMISLNIPIECEHWHLSKLFTLIRVCSEKNSPPKKMSRREIAERNRQLNEQRRAQMKTTG